MNSVEAAFDVLDDDGDDLVGIRDFQRLHDSCAAVRQVIAMIDITAAFDRNREMCDSAGLVPRLAFRGGFFSAIFPHAADEAESKNFALTIVRGYFGLIYDAFGDAALPLSRATLAIFLDHISGSAKAALAPFKAAVVAKTLASAKSIAEQPSAFVHRDEFVLFFEGLTLRGSLPPSVVGKAAATFKPPTPIQARARGSSVVASQAKHHHLQSAVDGLASMSSDEVTFALNAAKELAEARKEIQQLRGERDRLAKMLAATGTKQVVASTSNSTLQQVQAQVTELQSALAQRDAALDAQAEQLRTKERAMAIARESFAVTKAKDEADKRALEHQVASLESKVAVLQRYAESQQSWTALFSSLEATLRATVAEASAGVHSLKMFEVNDRVQAATKILEEAQRKVLQSDTAKLEAEAVLHAAAQKEQDVQLSEALLAAREQKFATATRKAEHASLPERTRRLEMLQSIEVSVASQMRESRAMHAQLLLREKLMVDENCLLREQIALLSEALEHANQQLLQMERRLQNAAGDSSCVLHQVAEEMLPSPVRQQVRSWGSDAPPPDEGATPATAAPLERVFYW